MIFVVDEKITKIFEDEKKAYQDIIDKWKGELNKHPNPLYELKN